MKILLVYLFCRLINIALFCIDKMNNTMALSIVDYVQLQLITQYASSRYCCEA